MADESAQLNLEDLSAYLDGELPEPRASVVARLVEQDPQWARALAELRTVDAALEEWQAPSPPEGLSQRILAASRRQPVRLWRRWRFWAGVSAAAAAAIVLVAVLFLGEASPPPKTVARQAPPASVEIREGDERLIVENLDFFRNYEVIENYETLQAIERLEDAGYGT